MKKGLGRKSGGQSFNLVFNILTCCEDNNLVYKGARVNEERLKSASKHILQV
jgi:hypothetical protein